MEIRILVALRSRDWGNVDCISFAMGLSSSITMKASEMRAERQRGKPGYLGFWESTHAKHVGFIS